MCACVYGHAPPQTHTLPRSFTPIWFGAAACLRSHCTGVARALAPCEGSGGEGEGESEGRGEGSQEEMGATARVRVVVMLRVIRYSA